MGYPEGGERVSLRDLATKRADRTSTTTSLITLIDEHLENRSNGKRRPGYHPSELGYRFCPRLYALLGLGLLIGEKRIDAQLQRTFDNGHYVHDRYHKYIREIGGLLTERPEIVERGKKYGRKRFPLEVRLDHPVGITGNCDAILELDSFLEIDDWKSSKQEVFMGLFQPLGYNEKQLTVYLGMLNTLYEGDPPLPLRGRILYENKNDGSLREFIVPWDDHHRMIFDQLVRYLEIVNQAVEQNTPELAPCIESCGSCDGYDIAALREKPKTVRM